MTTRAEVRKLIATLPEETEFDYTLVKDINNGRQVLLDLVDIGELILLRKDQVIGKNTRNVYAVAPKQGDTRMLAVALDFLLGGSTSNMKPPKGTMRTHLVGF